MGVLRFWVPGADRLTPEMASRAYITGADPFPWVSRVRLKGNELAAERATSDSGRFHIPWRLPNRGELTLATATLMESDKRYHLPLELARGEIYRLRQHTLDWQALGLVVPENIIQGTTAALHEFSVAATLQHDPTRALAPAERAIAMAVDVGDALVSCFIDQALAVRHRITPRLDTRLGINLGPTRLARASAIQIVKAFNQIATPVIWKDIEAVEGSYSWQVPESHLAWAKSQNLMTTAGPLLRFDAEGIPDWMHLWEGDFENILSFASDFVETAVRRLRGKVDIWQCAARVASTGILGLKETEQLQLAVRAIEITRSLDPNVPTILVINQPWAERFRTGEHDLSPLRVIDELLRAGLRLDGLGLEINAGYVPGGSYLRSRLSMNRMIDLWASLGLPLHIFLTVPSGEEPDPLARGKSLPIAGGAAGGWSPRAQRKWLQHCLPLLLAKPTVHSIVYNQWHDSVPHEFPHSGLVTAEGVLKTGFKAFRELREEHLL